MKEFRCIIAGGRDFNDHDLCMEKCKKILTNKENVVIISGTANGADLLGENFATCQGYDLERYPANWDDLDVIPCVVKYTKKGKPYNALAGHNRNQIMSIIADALILFWDGKSTGSKDMLNRMRKLNKPVRIVRY